MSAASSAGRRPTRSLRSSRRAERLTQKRLALHPWPDSRLRTDRNREQRCGQRSTVGLTGAYKTPLYTSIADRPDQSAGDPIILDISAPRSFPIGGASKTPDADMTRDKMLDARHVGW